MNILKWFIPKPKYYRIELGYYGVTLLTYISPHYDKDDAVAYAHLLQRTKPDYHLIDVQLA
jgi:hypothetical protein